MLIGFTVEPYKKWSPANIITAMHQFGIRFVELNLQTLTDFHTLKESMRGMTAAFHLPLIEKDGWDFSCVDYRSQIEQMVALLNQHARDLHISHIIAHPPEPKEGPAGINTNEEVMFSNLQRLPVPIYFENVPSWEPNSFRTLLDRAQQKLHQNYAGMCFDAAHFYVTGQNPIFHYLSFKEKIGCAHFSDCHEGDDAHLPFGCGGSLPIDELLACMHKHRFKGSITLEMMPHTTDQLIPFVRSYLQILKSFHYRHYLTTILRMWTLRSLLKSFSQ